MYINYTKKNGVPPGYINKILLVMRLTTVILIVSFMQVSAATLAQRITLSENKASLESILKAIRKQSGYDFYYTRKVIANNKQVSVNIKNATLEEALDNVFEGLSLAYTIADKIVVIKKKEPSFLESLVDAFVNIDVKGKVVDEKGENLAGASVKIKGTDKVVFTNTEGEFYLHNIDEKAVLVISYVGFEAKEINVAKDLGVIKLQMAIGKLDEVSVTVSSGYQQLPKERATGSFTSVSNKKLNEQVSTDILSRLPAVANGLMADNSVSGANGRFIIRGLSTIRGPKTPLIVLDNFPYEGNINNINPNDVESVTLLKDAAASSIWGARAGNGVVVITTKKGAFNRPVNISLNVNSTLETKPDLSDIKQISSSDFIDVEEILYKNKYYNSRINSSTKPPLSPVVELLIKYKGDITNPEYKRITNSLRTLDVRKDFDKYLYQAGLKQQYALSLDGGSQKHNWIASAGYDLNSGVLDEKYQRFNLRFNNTYQLVNNLNLTTEIYYTLSRNLGGRPAYGSIALQAYGLYPYARFADDNGNPLILAQKRQTYIESLKGGELLDWNYYPLLDYKYNESKIAISDVLINTGLNYTFFKGFNIDLKYQHERGQTTRTTHANEKSYFARNLVNTYTQVNNTTGEVIYKVPKGGILDSQNGLLQVHNLRGQLNFSHSWNKHEVNVIGGTEFRSARTTSNSNRRYGYNPAILTSGQVDNTTPYREYISGALSNIPGNNELEDILLRYRSLYSNGSYTYNGKYMISASGRRDASNLFGLSTNDKWNLLWSVGGSWEINKEAFYKWNLIPYLRLRTTYGFSGNIDPAMSAVTTVRYFSPTDYKGFPYARFNNYSNPELRWETAKMFNLGLDFRFANNRFGGSIEYYRKNGDHLFGDEVIDQTYGIGATVRRNVAKMTGSGIDIELNSINIEKKNFSWTTDFNFSYNRDEVVDYYLYSTQAIDFIMGGNNITATKGKPVYSMFSFKWAGLDPKTGDPRGYFDGKETNDYAKLLYEASIDDLEYSGPIYPVVFGSLGNTFSYAGLSISLQLTYKLGHYFRRSSIEYSNLFSRSAGHTDYARRWQKGGDEKYTDVPSAVYSVNSSRDSFYSRSSILTEKADHVRLQYVTLSYALNERIAGKLGMKNLSVFANANNLGLIWTANKLGLDPEYQYGNTLRPSKSFSIGLRASIN